MIGPATSPKQKPSETQVAGGMTFRDGAAAQKAISCHGILRQAPSLTVSHDPCACVLILQAAGAAWQGADETDGEAATNAGDRVRHMPLKSGWHRAAGSLWVAQVP